LTKRLATDINLQARMKGLGGQDRGDLSTPLHRACLSGRLDVISAMVEGLPSKGAIVSLPPFNSLLFPNLPFPSSYLAPDATVVGLIAAERQAHLVV
jgi:hypothetical protein